MSLYAIEGDTLNEIARAIQEKAEIVTPMRVADMALNLMSMNKNAQIWADFFSVTTTTQKSFSLHCGFVPSIIIMINSTAIYSSSYTSGMIYVGGHPLAESLSAVHQSFVIEGYYDSGTSTTIPKMLKNLATVEPIANYGVYISELRRPLRKGDYLCIAIK